MTSPHFIRYLLPAICLLMPWLICACSDDTELPADDIFIKGRIEYEGDIPISVFTVATPDPYYEWKDCRDASFELRAENGKSAPMLFYGSVINNNKQHLVGQNKSASCRMKLGTATIPDGRYLIKIKGSGLPDFGTQLVDFEESVGTAVPYKSAVYEDLNGHGTKESPYLINNAGDFLTLLYNLQNDKSERGYGKYFRQMASFDLPRRSEVIAGRSWASVPFAGHYDGAGFELHDLAYIGGSDPSADTGVGIFTSLLSGCVIEHVNITGAIISNADSRAGILAGESYGDVSLSDITFDGTVTGSGSGIGGLVGYAEGNLSLSRITITNLILNGAESTGGVLGSFCGNSLSIQHVSTPNYIFSVNGSSEVGVIAGHIATAGRVSLSDIQLSHNVDAESSDAKVAYGSGDRVGVVVGSLKCGDGSALEAIAIKCPVRGNKAVGGVAGRVEIDGRLTVDNVLLASVVNGNDAVGGFAGEVRLANSGSTILFTGDDNSTRFVIKGGAAAQVQGKTAAGGLIGYLDGNGGRLTFDSKVQIAINVTASSDRAGGAFGHIRNTRDMSVSNIDLPSATMRVTAGNSDAGGIVGLIESSDIKDTQTLDLVKAIPDTTDLRPSYRGIVLAGNNAGGVAGALYEGSITGLACNALVTADGIRAGGIVGESRGDISQCAFYGHVRHTGHDAIGGIAAVVHHTSRLTQCINYADIDGGLHQGGIAGYVSYRDGDINISYCVNKGKLSGGANAGGIAGYVGNRDTDDTSCNISYCANYGHISADGDSETAVGGIGGNCEGYRFTLSHSANHATVESAAVQYAIGGIAGHVGIDPPGAVNGYGNDKVFQCMNSGRISCDDTRTKLGGIVGYLDNGRPSYDDTYIKDCYNTGDIECDQKDDTGGILGCADAKTNIARTFNRGKISHGNAIIGTHNGGCLFDHSDNYYLDGTGNSWPSSKSVSAADIGKESSYGGFDFTNIWKITSEGPVLRDCPFQ